MNRRVTSVLLSSDDLPFLLDYRSNIYLKYSIEWVNTLIKKLLQVNERRHGEELNLPMAISIEELRDQRSAAICFVTCGFRDINLQTLREGGGGWL